MSLEKVRIWLSGSAGEGEAERIQNFVETFASGVFSKGGTILHGSHPSIRGALLNAASEFKEVNEGDKAPLGLFVSRLFSKKPEDYDIDLRAWEGLCGAGVHEVPETLRSDGTSDQEHRENCLAVMRERMAGRCNVIVAIGGRWWDENRPRAGVPNEIQVASKCRMPLFLLGGMGGAVEGLLQEQSDLLRDSANGLSLEENKQLAEEPDPTRAAQQVIEQLRWVPVRSVAAADDRPFRILSLDGGGIRGAYTAAVLAYWEKALQLHQPNRPRIVDHFDLISGTSTGAILAIGLGLGMSAQQILQFYRDKGESIFGSSEGLIRWWHSIRHWFTSKFDQENLKQALQAAYSQSEVASKGANGAKLPQHEWFNNSACRLVIPTYDTEIDDPYVFRTPHGRFKHSDRGYDPVAVALASSAAPTYFKPVKTRKSVSDAEFVDGGVWANSPVTVAIAEAIGELEKSLDQIRVLSIGTTHTAVLKGQPMLLDGKTIGGFLRKMLTISGAVSAPVGWMYGKLAEKTWPSKKVEGVLGWVANIAGLLMKTQAQTSDLVANNLLGERYLRVDSESSYSEFDDVANINNFAGLGEKAAKHTDTFNVVQSIFLNGEQADRWNQQSF